MTTKHIQMRNAINDVELALNELEIDDIARLFEGSDDSVLVKVPLGALRQLANCYPELNRIINDPSFEKPTPTQPSDNADVTPAARWRDAGQPDPHSNRYDCERAQLPGGKLTDDELANLVYLEPTIGNLTLAKERIRWLSRKLVAQPSDRDAVVEKKS